MRTMLLCYLLVISIITVVNAEDKNPDGVLNAPTITIWGGLGEGRHEYTIWENGFSFSQDGNINGSTIAIEIIYPTTKSLSLILRFNASWEKLESPGNVNFYEKKSEVRSRVLILGVRFFTR